MSTIPRNDTASGWFIALMVALALIGLVAAAWRVEFIAPFGSLCFILGTGIGRRSLYRKWS